MTRRGERVDLRPQALEVLCHLASRPGRVITKTELLDAVWPGVVVTDDSLVQAIGDARRAIGDDAHHLIQTVPRRGYRFVPFVAAGPGPVPAPRSRTAASGADWRRTRRWLGSSALIGLSAAWFVAWAPWQHRADVMGADPVPDKPPIAVLDFGTPDDTPREQQFARGFAEDLTTELARNADLRVIAAQSSFAATGRGEPWSQVAERLGVRYVVNGRLRRDGEQLRVHLRLLDHRNARVVWSSNHDVTAEQLYATRDMLVQRIAGSLLSTMRRNETVRSLQRPPASLDIYEMTLRAITLKHRFTPHDSREARALLEKVTAIDPQYAPGWLYLGFVNMTDAALRLNGPLTPQRVHEAIQQMERAIELDPNLPAAYVGLSFAYPYANRQVDAVKAGRRCIELGPSDAECMSFLALALVFAGQPEEALQHTMEAMSRQPLPPSYVLGVHAIVLWANRQNEAALATADEVLRQAPGNLVTRISRLTVLTELGRLDEARADATAILRQAPETTTAVFAARFAPEARGLSDRRVSAALQAGIPPAAVHGVRATTR